MIYFICLYTVTAPPSLTPSLSLSVGSTEFILSWMPIEVSTATQYILNLTYRGECANFTSTTGVMLDIATTQYTFSDLEEFSVYVLLFAASNPVGTDPPMTFTYTTLAERPSGPVQNLVVTSSNSTSITIQWEREECIERNSEITGYLVSPSYTTTSEMISGTDMREYTAFGLIPRTRYAFTVYPIGTVSPFRSSTPRTVFGVTNSSTGE